MGNNKSMDKNNNHAHDDNNNENNDFNSNNNKFCTNSRNTILSDNLRADQLLKIFEVLCQINYSNQSNHDYYLKIIGRLLELLSMEIFPCINIGEKTKSKIVEVRKDF